MFRFSAAIVRGISRSLPENALRMDADIDPVNLALAQKQHDEYVDALKLILGESGVHELAADDSYPDCVFVEDPVVVCGKTALVTRPGHGSRRGESDAFLPVLNELGLHVEVMEEPATMDGGDVMFTGHEFFVGVSARTNQEGVDALKRAFPGYPVHGITVDAGLHLKSMMSMISEAVVAIGCSSAAISARKQICIAAQREYEFVEFADDLAANLVCINGTVFHVPASEFPASRDSLELLKQYGRTIELSNSELNKVDGALTCCSVLLS